ncbi:cytochrome c biogenesis protein CcsA [Lignipirellula cremea]|uniref:Cytochrome C assembly protein n=1 Tax=Lignipirellula cremea TaxID=2528010 RepID=A0A518DTZ7_9BACT|nr:cytochrome c biogenesis protein CcsA [Lignipirellula cremea]QDU95312.1 Cytochrome C assembly protein [Lignipirellula cremea]
MSQFIAGISITCFAASYLVVLGLEVSRLFVRASIRLAVIMTFAAAGLLAHSIYLGRRAVEGDGAPLSSWYDWCLMAAWIVVAAYLWILFRRPEASFGLFMMPLVMILIFVAYLFRDVESFDADRALFGWRAVHGLALLSGTAVVTLGFAAGVMFLVQSYRLKHKLPPSERLTLPSLERLQWASEYALVLSSVFLLLGLVSGIVMNLIRSGDNSIAWTDPVIWSSGVLLLWLVAASLFNVVYRPARRGRKVAYLVVASFLFLGLELGVVLWTQHAVAPQTSDRGGSVPAVLPIPLVAQATTGGRR